MKIQMKTQNQKFVTLIKIVVQLIFRNKRKIKLINISKNQIFFDSQNQKKKIDSHRLNKKNENS